MQNPITVVLASSTYNDKALIYPHTILQTVVLTDQLLDNTPVGQVVPLDPSVYN